MKISRYLPSYFRTATPRVARLVAAVSLMCAVFSPQPGVSTAKSLQTAAQETLPAQTKQVTVFGAKINYLEAGSGPVLILLHGLGGDSSNWSANIGPLSQQFRVIVPDQIGFGRSDKPLLNYRVATLVDFLDGFLKQLRIEKATLVGNSLGGLVSASYALAYPEKVDKLVLVDSAGYAIPKDVDPRIVSALNASTREDLRKLLPLVFYYEQFRNEAMVDMFLTRRVTAGDGYTIQRLIESLTRGEDLLEGKTAKIKHKTLIIWGREDGLTPLAMGERFKKEIPGAQMIVFDKCGHVPQLEKAAEFNAALKKFLQ